MTGDDDAHDENTIIVSETASVSSSCLRTACYDAGRPMQAVILAAGRSTRTHPVTENRPKPLVPVWGRPFLERQLRQLPTEVSQVVIVVGFLREQIEAHFGARFEDRPITYVPQKRQRGTADALLAARPHIRSRCLVLNGDDFYDATDLAALARSGRGILVGQAPDPENRGVVTVKDERVVNVIEKPVAPPKNAWCSLGGYCIEPRDLEHLDELKPSERGELELPDFVLRIVREREVQPVFRQGLWLPLTYAWDVLGVMIRFWAIEERARELAATPSHAPGAQVTVDGPVWLGESVTLGRNVTLKGPVALGDGTVVRDKARLDSVVTFEGATIGSEAEIECSVVGARATVGDGAKLLARPGRELAIDVKGKRIAPDIERLGAILGDGAAVKPGESVPAGTVIERSLS